MPKDKIIAFDFLRVFAIFSVIVLHTSAELFLELYPSNDWLASNFYESFSRWNVAIFFMISGALFLRKSKKLDLKRLYSKNILHIVVVFFFWSIIYAIFESSDICDFNATLNNILIGPHHFWFLKALVGLYIAIPIFKYIVSRKKLEFYFLLATFIFGIIIPSFIVTSGVFNKPFELFLVGIYDKFNLQLISTYSFYFVIGHYLIEYPIKTCYKHIIYILGAISPFIVMLSTYFASNHNGEAFQSFYENYFICTSLEAIAIFVFFTSHCKSGKFNHIFEKLSPKVMGIYIVHILVMYHLDKLGIYPNSYNALLFIPIYSLIVFIISFIIVAILQKVPFIKKWLI